uniref:Uncharacterized protein n=1 Tax=Leptocylindrus danicus TaxID=163516 RepID=A0A7S2LN39_9STRA|mmetsp:Transcript_7277/g.10871  ORF Transcript_7277/g.10871 Transcript_7277/m.10871 type:complete len:101 (+) Transcript_7277:244-546(+)|eukprot:CAMPEP_0116034980 /NCGR_PEP_ID=MMETSP0321-20121206/20022_1 /TAXON_ID=163516 /ORGANISM="Leptocylindrus danicus var. danicus, Strain B650" /LENGTH=100 /DNA_ID=CAMNT_0003511579 /DNA_START=167 /DNA_END=469 /DNA_ORIENTATION=+
MPQPNSKVNVWKYLEEWNRCISSTYQRDQLYRLGNFDTCSRQWEDVKIAFRAKASSDPKEAQLMLEETYYRKNLGSDTKNSPTAGYIWELKEHPGWDVEN